MSKKEYSSSSQPSIKEQTLSLYYYDGCPFCHITLKALEQVTKKLQSKGTLGKVLEVELRHIRRQPQYRTELVKLGGKPQVPCLRIDNDNEATSWLYESREIIQYLHSRANN